MRDPHVARQRTHVARAEHITHQTGGLVHVESTTVAGDNARRILPAMLQNHQAIVEQLVNRRGCDNPENPAHDCSLNVGWKRGIRREKKAANFSPHSLSLKANPF